MFSNPVKNVEEFDLNPGFKVADFGSGSGFYVMEAAKKVGDKGKVYAIDVQKDLLNKLKDEAIKSNLFNVEIVWSDLDEVKGSGLTDNFLDAVIASNILFQISDKKVLVAEIWRVLKKGGRVLAVDWLDSFGGLGPQSSDIFSKEEAEDLFKKFGFEKVIELGEIDHHWAIIFRKI